MIGDFAQDLYNWVPVVVLVAPPNPLKKAKSKWISKASGWISSAVNEICYSLCASSATCDRADYLKYNPVVFALYSRHTDNSLDITTRKTEQTITLTLLDILQTKLYYFF